MAANIKSFDHRSPQVIETISQLYLPQSGNRKAIRIITVAVYMFFVSLAAIMLSLYYIFIWDPTIKPYMPKVPTCDKLVIPEHIAIRFINSSQISADQFYKNILRYYETLQIKKPKIEIKSQSIQAIPKTTIQQDVNLTTPSAQSTTKQEVESVTPTIAGHPVGSNKVTVNDNVLKLKNIRLRHSHQDNEQYQNDDSEVSKVVGDDDTEIDWRKWSVRNDGNFNQFKYS